MCHYQEMCSKSYILFLLQSGGVGGGMSSNATPMSRSGMDNMGGSYAGANDMTNNGLSANQNQVNQNIL